MLRKPAQREEHVLRAGADRHRVEGRAQILPAALVRRDEAEQQVGMRRSRYFVPASIAISTPLACELKNSGVAQVLSISTIASRACATAAIAGMSCISNDSEPGASVNTARVLGLNSARDVRAEQRVVIGRLDAEALQHRVAEIARRPIDRVRHQQMVAGLQAAHQRDRNRREPGGNQHRPGRAGEIGPGDFERIGGRRSLGAVGELGLALEEVLRVAIEHGRAAIDRRVHEAVLGERIAAPGDQARRRRQRLFRAAAALIVGYPVHLCCILRPIRRHLLRQVAQRSTP